MTYLYLRYTVPQLILDKEIGEIVKQGIIWIDNEAKVLYDFLQEKITKQMIRNAKELNKFLVVS